MYFQRAECARFLHLKAERISEGAEPNLRAGVLDEGADRAGEVQRVSMARLLQGGFWPGALLVAWCMSHGRAALMPR